MHISYNESLLSVSIDGAALEIDTGYLDFHWFTFEDEIFFCKDPIRLDDFRTKLVNNAGFISHDFEDVFAEVAISSLKIGGFSIYSEIEGQTNSAIVCLNSKRI